MGSGSSSAVATASEGELFLRIAQPARKSSVVTGSASKETSASDDGKGATKVAVAYKARILKLINYETLWNNFLEGPSNTFALSFAEMTVLLTESMKSGNTNSEDAKPLDASKVQEAIKSYIELLKELNGTSSATAVDFMSLCSSILLLSNVPIEVKVDKLFEWITMGEGEDSFSFDDFFVAINSFERGIYLCNSISRYGTYS